MRIGILSLPLGTNYGGILQSYALLHTLHDMGHEAYVIDEDKQFEYSLKRRIEMFVKGTIKRCLMGKNAIIYSPTYYRKLWAARTMHTNRFVSRHISRKMVRNMTEIGVQDFDAFVVGSDQIWRARYARPFPGVENSFLKFTEGWNVKRLAYAASFGTDEWEYNKAETANVAAMARMFDAISVREVSGVGLCQKYLGVEAMCMIDPTLLLNAEDYTRLIGEDTPPSPGNMMCYVLDRSVEKDALVNDIACEKGLRPFHTNSRTEDHKATLEERIQPPVEQWLKGFRDAEFVVTDSYHACIFSILYRKPFVVIGNKSRGMTRFESLLQVFGLEGRLVTSYEDYKQKKKALLCPIDYEPVYRILEERRTDALRFLQESLH